VQVFGFGKHIVPQPCWSQPGYHPPVFAASCPGCGREVSTLVTTCPRCGSPIAQAPPKPGDVQSPACPNCGAHTVGKVRGLHGVKEVTIGVVLLLCFIVPGIIYYIYMKGVPYCTSCGHRLKKPGVPVYPPGTFG
jgi:predicted RNA-binding Zn-ribbon protein involved in translation (DUF1610 family)